MKNEIRGMSDMTSVRRGTVGRNINTCHATRGFLAAVGPYPRPDCGEAQIPGGWAVQPVIALVVCIGLLEPVNYCRGFNFCIGFFVYLDPDIQVCLDRDISYSNNIVWIWTLFEQ